MKAPKIKKRHIHQITKGTFWFLVGASLAIFLILSFSFIIFRTTNRNVVYPGVIVDGVNFGGKTQRQVETYFADKNDKISKSQFVFSSPVGTVSASAKDINFGYDGTLLATQAFSIGRSKDIFSNASLIVQAYINGVDLSPSYRYSDEKLSELISPLEKKINTDPVDALFNFSGGRVLAFRPSSEGQALDREILNQVLESQFPVLLKSSKPQTVYITIPIKALKPQVSTDKANNLGIKELIGAGTSLFQHSIPNRIYNITLASTRLNGILVAPGETFSFDKALGDVSAFTGYKQAYVIENGKTILGDGGGVCQVSTTFFRAILNAGLPVEERHAHAYRVGYYEQDSPPGIDATIYSPSVDLRFKNDTESYILIQTFVDPQIQRLTFFLYGTTDGRQVEMSKPVITNQTAPSPPQYQDDPTRPKGSIEQTDFEAWGANVYFTRQVTKNGKVIISERYDSNYRPWQAVYIRGTKE